MNEKPHTETHPPSNQQDAAGAGDPVDPVDRVTLRGPDDLLALVPHLLGFYPDEGDIVLVTTDGERIQHVAATRVARLEDADQAWDDLSVVLAHAPTAAFLVAYLGPEASHVLQHLSARLGPVIDDVLIVHAGRWWSLGGVTLDPHYPPEGHCVEDLMSPFGAWLTLRRGSDLPERSDLSARVQPGPAPLLDQVRRHLAALTHADRAGDEPAHQPPGGDPFTSLRLAHADASQRPAYELGVQEAASLLYVLRERDVRDACLLWRDEAALQLWLELVRHAPPGWVAPVAVLVATTAFQQGDTALARVAAERARADARHYTLADLVLRELNRNIEPAVLTDALIHATNLHPPARGSRRLPPATGDR